MTRDLADKSLLIVHASKHYHTNPDTILFSSNVAKSFHRLNYNVVALSQHSIKKDLLWYVLPNLITRELHSRMGEHQLTLAPRHSYEFYLIGGYQSACLSRAMAHLIANSFNNWKILELNLLTKGIFTGFQFKNGGLTPSIDEESWADTSVDGLSLFEATKNMNDEDWKAFIKESLQKSIFKINVLRDLNLTNTTFEIYRNSKKIFSLKDRASNKAPQKIIRIYYR